MSKALKIPGSGSETAHESASGHVEFGKSATNYVSNQEVFSSGQHVSVPVCMDRNIPTWCHHAFQIEDALNKRDRTEWDFVVPVWIAITLFCTMVQVIGFKALNYIL
ncbi:MAG: hypothetical protein AAFV59_06715 [Pseudomonadota bacterium]